MVAGRDVQIARADPLAFPIRSRSPWTLFPLTFPPSTVIRLP